MDKADRGLLYHLGSALGARDSRNRVSWLSAHLLDFPAHEAYRKQLLYDPSSTFSLVYKWGPSTRNIIRSMECAALGLVDPIEEEVEKAVMRICNNPSAIFEEALGIRMPQSEDSSVIFLRRTPDGSVKSDRGKAFIPTLHLLTTFEKRRVKKPNEEALEIFYAIFRQEQYQFFRSLQNDY
jgi:hypothetical protein